MKKFIPITVFCLGAVFLIGLICYQPVKKESKTPKINGISFVAPVRAVKQKALVPIKKMNASWVAITPYAFSETGQPKVSFNYNHQWWGERREGVEKTITYAKALGLKVMLKPHVWVHGPGNSWTGNFNLTTKQQWNKWGKSYASYILSFAKMADSLGVDLICIGTEYKKAASEHPEIWRRLIKKLRRVYSGQLTYAANWDNYQNIPFWDALDYIGIDAYFPLTDERNPTESDLEQRWQPVKQKLHQFSKQQSKPILFTEFGYKSVNYTTDGHWKYHRGQRAVNEQAQVNAYKALLQTFWGERWFAGGFVWKWYHNSKNRYHHNRAKGFTPQGKPAEKTLREWYDEDGSY